MLLSTLNTPIGKLNLIADEHVLLGANLSNIKALTDSLGADDSIREIKSVAKIPVLSQLIEDYFDGDISAINAIKVMQPGAAFSQAAWKAMRKVKGTISYADLAERAGSPAAVRAADLANIRIMTDRKSVV